LKLLNASRITAIRSGREVDILSEEIVLEDILILEAGDKVPVDCKILTDGIVDVNESLLTGESRSVKKTVGDTLYAGSLMVAGKCTVIAEKVGANTYIHSVEVKAKGFKKPKSKLMIGINRIIKIFAGIAIPLTFIMFINQSFRDGSFIFTIGDANQPIIKSLFIIPYMVPVGMVLLTSIAMTTGVVVLSKKKVLANDLYSVEALSRIDTLCLDKTGTITDGTMTVEKSIVYGSGDINEIIASYLGAFEVKNQTSTALIK